MHWLWQHSLKKLRKLRRKLLWRAKRPGQIVIETSTLPIAIKEQARKLLAVTGITLLDCPLSGTGAQARVKDLAVYASGQRSAYRRCRPIFEGFARTHFFLGPFGAGSKMKFLANLLVAIHNVSAAEALVPRTRVYGALDTLENLKKGGRVGGAQALIGSMLSIKPIIEVRDGQVEPESKQRTRSRALRYLADKVRQEGTIENLAVMHGDAPDLDEFLDLLDPLFGRDEIVIGDIGAVIGTHAGPRVIGMAFQVP